MYHFKYKVTSFGFDVDVLMQKMSAIAREFLIGFIVFNPGNFS